jgi:type III secretion protein U
MAGEKNKKPTAKRKREAVKKGDVAKVPTIGKLLALVAVIECTLASRDLWLDTVKGYMMYTISMVPSATGKPGNHAVVSQVAMPLLASALLMCLAVIGIAAFLALVGNIVQTGLVFSPEAIPKMQFLSPLSNFKMHFSGEQLLQVPLNILKVILIGLAIYTSIISSLDGILHIADGSLDNMINAVLDLIGATERSAIAYIFICVLLDWILRRHFNNKQMMMSHEEVERENKEIHGDKHVRGARKKLSHELLFGQAAERTRKADAVVTNPTHFAIALRYSPEECPLPVVLTRSSGELALHVIATAKKHGIPVVRSVWLARTLYAVGREGKPIPRLTLRAVAAVYRAIIELSAQDAPPAEVIDLEADNRT